LIISAIHHCHYSISPNQTKSREGRWLIVPALLLIRVSMNKITVRASVRPRRADPAKKRFIMSSRLFIRKTSRLPPVPSLGILWLVYVVAGLAMTVPALAASKPSTNDLPAAASRIVDFAKEIQPIFAGHCYECHGPNKQEAQFRLDSKAIALK